MTFTFDLFAHDDPYPLYARAPGVFFADAFGVWVVTRPDDVRTVLTDVERFSSAYLIRTPLAPAPGVTAILAEGHPEVRILLNQDPPEHTRVRGLVAAAFSPRRVRTLTPRVQEITDELIEALDDPADLVSGLALPLPLRVIAELIGVPPADVARVRAGVEELKLLTSFGATAEQQHDAARGSVDFERYLAALISARRAAPRDDLLSDLVATPLTTDELISLLITLIFGGHETTANLIGTALLLTLRRPELWAALPTDPALVDAVVEETLRYDPPVQGSFRIAVADTTLGGVDIPAGAQLYAALGAANRAASDDFDPGREHPEPHLSFERGIHFCVGAQLARLEARTALTTLARRRPGLRPVTGFQAPYLPNLLHRGPARLDATVA